ncbi:MAG: deoxyribonuclease IV [Candidatus Beckwithbacteria bacterium]|nr:deoxyribonuclease IV [Candidatus Beckwithbacteria bacterium]
MRRIGAHLSISGGLDKAVEAAVRMGGNSLQIFSSSPRMWLAALPKEDEVKKFKATALQDDIQPIFIHAKYLINLGSDKTELVAISKKSLKHDLLVASLIGAEGVIVHLGSHQGRGFSAIQEQLVNSIKEILQDSSKESELIIENSAGQKGKICSQLSEISLLMTAINDSRIRWCLDTCHAWGAGFSFAKDLENTLQQFDLVKSLVCLHVNDSKGVLGGGLDRHENLGKGKMGLEELAKFVNYPAFKDLPLIIETPGFDGHGPDKKNLEILKKLANE